MNIPVLSVPMADFQIGHSPTFVTHIMCHDTQSFGFYLPGVFSSHAIKPEA